MCKSVISYKHIKGKIMIPPTLWVYKYNLYYFRFQKPKETWTSRCKLAEWKHHPSHSFFCNNKPLCLLSLNLRSQSQYQPHSSSSVISQLLFAAVVSVCRFSICLHSGHPSPFCTALFSTVFLLLLHYLVLINYPRKVEI